MGGKKPVATSVFQLWLKGFSASEPAFFAMAEPGEKVEYKLQGTILRVKKANGDVSSVVAGKSVVLKSVTEDGKE